MGVVWGGIRQNVFQEYVHGSYLYLYIEQMIKYHLQDSRCDSELCIFIYIDHAKAFNNWQPSPTLIHIKHTFLLYIYVYT